MIRVKRMRSGCFVLLVLSGGLCSIAQLTVLPANVTQPPHTSSPVASQTTRYSQAPIYGASIHPIASAPADMRLDDPNASHAPPFTADETTHLYDDTVPSWLFDTINGIRRPDRVVHAVLPKQTDSAIATNLGKNIALFNRSDTAASELLVFMQGSGSNDGLEGGLFLNYAADAGYHVIGLNYDSGAVQIRGPGGRMVYLDTSTDHSVIAAAKEHLVFGAPMPGANYGKPSESIENRLAKLLAYLNTHYPDEGWGQYLVREQPNWPEIVIGGHSNGASMAAYIGKRRPVARVFLSSSPVDHYGGDSNGAALVSELNRGDFSHQSLHGRMATWMLAPSATDVSRWYGVYAAREPYAIWVPQTFSALRIPASHIRALDIMPDRLISAPHYALIFHGCWFSGAVNLDAYWRPTTDVVSAWAFLIGTSP